MLFSKGYDKIKPSEDYSMIKKILDKDALFPKILEGMKEISGIVKRTLGPGGLPIIIQRVGQALDGSPLAPKITKDGVSVANECFSDDPEKDLVIQSVKAICQKTNRVAGDGTTTAIVLGEAILNEMLKVLKEDPTLNPQLVREEVELASKRVIEKLKQMAIPIGNNYDMVKQVACISANGDMEIGDILSKAFDKVGAEGVITVDEGRSNVTTLELVDGYQFKRGAEAQDRFFNNSSQTRFEAEKCYLLIYDGKLLNYTELAHALVVLYESVKPNHPPVVIIANEFSNESVQFLLQQRAEANLTFCAVRGPHQTTVRTGYYDDLAVLSGGTRLGNGNRNLNAVEADDFGLVDKILVDKYTTTIYGGQGTDEDVLTRVDQLKALKGLAESPYDAQVVGDRIAALTGGIAKIGVGGSTDFEIKEKYDRIEDALNASRAAIEEGIVIGGGVPLLKIAQTMISSTNIGDKILCEALHAPFTQIIVNVGLNLVDEDDYEIILQGDTLIYDARNKKIVDALEAGIIDPVKVVRCALENAVSIAALLSTAGGGIIYKKEKRDV